MSVLYGGDGEDQTPDIGCEHEHEARELRAEVSDLRAQLEAATKDRDEACEGESLRAVERDEALARAEAAERRAEELRQTLEEVQHHAESSRASAAEMANAAAEAASREWRLIAENARDGAKMRADQLAAAEKRATAAEAMLRIREEHIAQADHERDYAVAERDSLRARCARAEATLQRVMDAYPEETDYPAKHADWRWVRDSITSAIRALGSSRLPEEKK